MLMHGQETFLQSWPPDGLRTQDDFNNAQEFVTPELFPGTQGGREQLRAPNLLVAAAVLVVLVWWMHHRQRGRYR